MRAYSKEVKEFGVCPWRGVRILVPLLPLCFLASMSSHHDVWCHHRAKAMRPISHQLKTSKLTQNKPFLLTNWLPQVIFVIVMEGWLMQTSLHLLGHSFIYLMFTSFLHCTLIRKCIHLPSLLDFRFLGCRISVLQFVSIYSIGIILCIL